MSCYHNGQTTGRMGIASSWEKNLYLESSSDIPGVVHNNTNLIRVTFHVIHSSTSRNFHSHTGKTYTGKCPKVGNMTKVSQLCVLHSVLLLRFLVCHCQHSSRQTPLTWVKVVLACGEAFARGHPFEDVGVLVQHCERGLAVQSWPLQNCIVLSTAQVEGNTSIATVLEVGQHADAKPITLRAVKPGAFNDADGGVLKDFAEVANDPHSCGTGGLCQGHIINSNPTRWRARAALQSLEEVTEFLLSVEGYVGNFPAGVTVRFGKIKAKHCHQCG